MLTVTVAQLTAAAPGGNPLIIDAIASQAGRVFAEYALNSRNRILGFLSTALEETGGFNAVAENLNYSAERAHEVWPSRFASAANAEPFAHNPEALANIVYGGRLGNTLPGSGWKYRGRGLIQITGYDNYARLQKITGLPLVSQPDLLTNSQELLECSVALFCEYPSILTYCDKADWHAVWALVGSGRANGSVINLVAHEDALARLQKAIPALVDAPPVPAPRPPAPIPAPPDIPRPAPAPAPVLGTGTMPEWLWIVLSLAVIGLLVAVWEHFR